MLVWANYVIFLTIDTLFYNLAGVFWLREILKIKFNLHASLVGLVLLDQYYLLNRFLQVEIGTVFSEFASPKQREIKQVVD